VSPGLARDDPAGARLAGAAALAAAGLTCLTLTGASRPRSEPEPFTRESRDLHASAAALCASVLADSAVEHYRGGFENPGMYAPACVAGLGLLAGGDAATGSRLPRRVRDGVFGLAVATGAAGLGFHLYNLVRRPGGISWLNLFYAAPVGAPAALSLGGLLGLAADRVARSPSFRPRLLGLPAGRALAALSALGLGGTVGEAGLLHFRGAFQNPFMWLPVSLPPVAAVLTVKAALEPRAPPRRPVTRLWLRLTAVLGLAGVGFHAYGVSRAMGGWRNWRQNLVDGPPIPAPPSFSALALAGLASLRLREVEDG
jgi:hypothetical protein